MISEVGSNILLMLETRSYILKVGNDMIFTFFKLGNIRYINNCTNFWRQKRHFTSFKTSLMCVLLILDTRANPFSNFLIIIAKATLSCNFTSRKQTIY